VAFGFSLPLSYLSLQALTSVRRIEADPDPDREKYEVLKCKDVEDLRHEAEVRDARWRVGAYISSVQLVAQK
jgi:hypothetical protein